MKKIITYLLSVFIIAGSLGSAAAATLTYTDFSAADAFFLNGSAKKASNSSRSVLRLTDDLSQMGTAFLKDPVILGEDYSFQAFFSSPGMCWNTSRNTSPSVHTGREYA